MRNKSLGLNLDNDKLRYDQLKSSGELYSEVLEDIELRNRGQQQSLRGRFKLARIDRSSSSSSESVNDRSVNNLKLRLE